MSILEMKDICKSFDGVQVLKNVQLTVAEGEIHTILGENGAGKSTLMNILTGVIGMDSGSITFMGKPLGRPTIRETEALGIAFVHQELNLFPTMKVYENLFLTREYTNKLGTLKKKEMKERAQKLFSEMGVEIDPDAVVSELKMGQKQLLEIAKALLFDAKLFILDEPTTALNNEEIDRLFAILEKLRQGGKSFIFISHKMPEIFRISDSYTVLRNGEFIQSGLIKDVDPESIARLMVGQSYSSKNVYQTRKLGDTVLKLDKVSGKGFTGVSLEVKKGEILAVTGLQGSGSSELMQAVFGALPVESGSVEVLGKKLKSGSLHGAMKAHVAMLPSNRKENSVIPDMTILENTYISEHTLSKNRQHIFAQKEQANYEALKKLLSIKAQKSSDAVTSLSGGNQQKVFLARWLNTKSEILLLDNPTQGIDVGSKAEIYQLILMLAEQGRTIIINTLEIGEIQMVADRCAVFYDGRLLKVLPHDEIDEQTVMLYSTNAVQA